MDEDNELNGSEMSHDEEMESDDDWIDQTEDQQENVSPLSQPTHTQWLPLPVQSNNLVGIKNNNKCFLWTYS